MAKLFTRFRTGLAVAIVGVLAVAGNAVAQSDTPTTSSDQAGGGAPSVAATTRDLQTTTTASGQLERTDERTVGHGGTVTPLTTEDTSGAGDTSDDTSEDDSATEDSGDAETASASDTVALDDAEVTLASVQVAGGPTEDPTCAPEDKKDPPAEEPTPCEPEEPSESEVPTEVPSEPEEPSDAPSEPGEAPSEPGEPTPTPPPTEPGTPSQPPTGPGQPSQPGQPTEPLVPPAPEGVPGVEQPGMAGAPQQQVPSGAMSGAQQPGGVPGAGAPAAQGATAGPQGAEPLVEPAVLTSIADLGTDVKRGTTLYEADAEPVVALIGSIPMWRTLETGVDNGPDVRQLEKNLDKLGYGDDLTVDREFTDATAEAVEAWEDDLGRDDPDSVVEPSEVAYLTDRGAITAQEAAVGETLTAGAPVLTLSGESQIVSADVPVDQVGAWARGTEVELLWDDGGEATTGAVTGIGRDVAGSGDEGTVEATIALDEPETQRPNQSQVTASLIADSRPGAVAVPVSAIVADSDGQPAVRVVEGATERVVEVTTGLVDDGWIEVLDGVSAGDVVRLPG